MMNLAKVSANGQITVPIEIRRFLGLKSGDKILFTQNPAGEIILSNASVLAIRNAQSAFTGVADSLGVANEDDAQSLVDDIRYGAAKSRPKCMTAAEFLELDNI